ncbi:hypothetical protein KJA16_01280 [Patescibacteria group bacterium]|nr:hypothetical protein [Patescibacteria group bacterium]
MKAFLLFNVGINGMETEFVVLTSSPEELVKMCGGSLVKGVLTDAPLRWKVDAICLPKDFTPKKGFEALKKIYIAKSSFTTGGKTLYFKEIPILADGEVAILTP